MSSKPTKEELEHMADELLLKAGFDENGQPLQKKVLLFPQRSRDKNNALPKREIPAIG